MELNHLLNHLHNINSLDSLTYVFKIKLVEDIEHAAIDTPHFLSVTIYYEII